MKEPGFSRHTIADINDWKNESKLEIQPDFQRRAVWNQAARIMLIDSILKRIPLPKIFVGTLIKNGRTHRIVIDGQQRITSILDFIGNKFPLDAPYSGPHSGKLFKELDKETQDDILNYNLDFNEFQNYTDEEIREIYQRVNKYTFALTKQELRRADFPGEFLNLSEELSTIDYFDDAKVFTPASRRRLGDVEYISELLAILLDGIQDKKSSLDNFYMNYETWAKNDKENCKQRFVKIIEDLQVIFSDETFAIKKTRFRQRSDFYSMFSAINDLHTEKRKLDIKLVNPLIDDLNFLDKCIEPGAPSLLGEYAVKCVSDANSKSSRSWRAGFIKNFLLGAYEPNSPISEERLSFLTRFIGIYSDPMCPGSIMPCAICDKDVSEDEKNAQWCFPKGALFLEQARLAHKTCLTTEKSDLVFSDEH